MIKELISHFDRAYLLALVLFAIPYPTHATTHYCKGVDKEAKLGISSGASVSVSSHDKICEFAVDGVSPAGKQSPDFITSMNDVLSGSASRNALNEAALFSLLLGPFLPERPDPNLTNRFHNSFGTYVRDLAGCIASFQQNPSSSIGTPVNRDSLVCGVLDPDDRRLQYNDLPRFGMVETRVSQPTLRIGLIIDGQSFLLFIPVRLIALGMRGYRLGQ